MTRNPEPKLFHLPSLPSWGALLVAAIVFSWPLLTQPLLPNGSDASFHSQWAHSFAEALWEGNVYPRWVSDANSGLGAPTFLLYPPLGYYTVAFASLLTGNVIEALRLVFIVCAFVSGLSFFVAARGVSTEAGAALGAVLYVLLPYRALDLYDRFALGEYMAFVWFPWLFLGVRRLGKGLHWGAWFTLLGAYAGLLLTHLVTAFMVLFVLAPYAVGVVWGARRPGRLVPMALAGVSALLCCSVYVVPMLVHRGDVYQGGMVEGWFDWWRNFVFTHKSVPGFPSDPIKPWVDGSATTQALLTLAAVGLLALGTRRRGSEAAALGATPITTEGWLQAALAAWAFFLQTILSSPLYAVIPQLGEIQFPWRFSAFQMLAVCFLCSCALAAWEAPASRAPRIRRRALFIAAGCLALMSVPALLLTFRVMYARRYTLDETLARQPAWRYRFAREFLPRGVKDWQVLRRLPPEIPAATLRGPGNIKEVVWQTHARELRVETPAEVRLLLRTLAYPGWQVRIDGQRAPIVSDNPFWAIEVDVPPGIHKVDLIFMPTWDRQLGAMLSVLGLLTLGLMLGGIRRRRSLRPAAVLRGRKRG